MNHSPAPWGTPNHQIRDRTGLLLATMHHHLAANNIPQEANARLIAAAPDMLAVLQQTVSNMYDSGFSEYETKPLQDVINKATGES